MHVIGTAGHVDHGKSALVEALTGTDPDRFAEEKARGLTIDLGFAWMQLPSGVEVAIVDVPGHERFVKNMLAGIGGISVCLFVVAANEGFMPQTREHLAILDLLGVRAGVIAMTKVDLVEPGSLPAITEQIREGFRGTSLDGVPIVGCSAVNGSGLDALRDRLDAALGRASPSSEIGRPRLWVDRAFTMAGAGTVVTGTLEGGSFTRGDHVSLLPSGQHARIRTIQSHKRSLEVAAPGTRVALNLGGVQRTQVERGDAVVGETDVDVTRMVDVRIKVLAARFVDVEPSLTRRGSHLIYVGSAETVARIRLIGKDELRAGEDGFAQIRLDRSLPLRRGDRFVIRDAGRRMTIAGGRVLDPHPGPVRGDHGRRAAFLGHLAGTTNEEALVAFVEQAGRIRVDRALSRAGVARVDEGVIRLGDLLVSGAELERITELLHSTIAAHHRDHPLEPGIERGSLRAALDLDAGSFDALIARDDGVVAHGPFVRALSHSVRLEPAQEAERSALFEELTRAAFTPPPVSELQASPALLKSLLRSGELVRITDFYLTAELASEARARVRTQIEAGGPMTVAQIRDLLSTTRKYAVPLCEWLDATGATRRQGDLRTLGPTP